MEVDSLSACAGAARGARRLGDGFGSGGRLGHGGRGRSRRDSSRRRRLRLRGELLGRLRELLDGRRRRCARSRLAGDVQLIGVDDEAADRLDIVGRAGAVDPDGQRAIGALAGAHLTQVAHFLEQGLGVLVRHLGDAHARSGRPAPSPAGAAAAGSGAGSGSGAGGGAGPRRERGRRLRGSRRILMLQGQLPQYRADALEYGFVGLFGGPVGVNWLLSTSFVSKNMSTMSVRSAISPRRIASRRFSSRCVVPASCVKQPNVAAPPLISGRPGKWR